MAIRAHAAQLTALDQAIGDGDHGINMRRGFDAIAQAREELAALPLDQALLEAGKTLVMKVGGASGPLYGSFLMAMGKAAVPHDAASLAEAFGQGIEAVKKRGRSDVGEKTMLDVLVPTLQALQAGAADGAAPGALIAKVRAVAADGAGGDRADARDQGPRLVPRRALDRPSRSRRQVERAPDRSGLRRAGRSCLMAAMSRS